MPRLLTCEVTVRMTELTESQESPFTQEAAMLTLFMIQRIPSGVTNVK